MNGIVWCKNLYSSACDSKQQQTDRKQNTHTQRKQ